MVLHSWLPLCKVADSPHAKTLNPTGMEAGTGTATARIRLVSRQGMDLM